VRLRALAGIAAAAAALLSAPGASAAPPLPFGHVCVPQDGVLFCPAANDSQRVASWDGVPLDVDVTLPATGNGPFPTIVMMHGWGGDKTSFESHSATDGYSNVYYASQGYAVVTYTARGWGRSCGKPDSRTSPGCDTGWIHLADHRYEGRDTQHLLGLLVDEGIAKPDALGVTGISYGGIQTLNLARLRDRVRLPDGTFMPWRSPNGVPLAIKAGWARWAGSDLTYALQPNGRFLDFRKPHAGDSIRPGGVEKKSYNDVLYASGVAGGFYEPKGGPFNADITTWKELADRGEPVHRDARAVGRELTRFHSWAGLSGPSAALILQNGWTDDLFPAPEALRVYRTFTPAPGATLSLELGDLGHPRGTNDPAVNAAMTARANAFFAAYLKGVGRAPRDRSVLAFTQVCGSQAHASARFRARSWKALHPERNVKISFRRQRIRSNGGNAATAATIDPIGGGGACATVPARRARGTANLKIRFPRTMTMLGMPTVRARIVTKGRGGLIAARLWDVHAGRQTLVSRGVYRLRDNQRGRIIFQLFGNGWRFRKSHTARLELVGRDPNYLRTSNFRFSVRVNRLRVDLPVQ